MSSYVYIGSELELFAQAKNWKRHYGRRVRRHLGPDVLEVGAGIGATTQSLCPGIQRRWLCLEPDPKLAEVLQASAASGALPACCEVRVGTLAQLEPEERFDTILYIDVLEHIEDDRAELERAGNHLKPGGRLIVLAPAHQWLFTPFDAAIGHFRRYTKKSLAAAVPDRLARVELGYLDAVGLLASLGNRLLLRSPMPTPRQIAAWDRLMVPVSRLVDPILFHAVGKSVLGVWKVP